MKFSEKRQPAVALNQLGNRDKAVEQFEHGVLPAYEDSVFPSLKAVRSLRSLRLKNLRESGFRTESDPPNAAAGSGFCRPCPSSGERSLRVRMFRD
jgi:hypothetical protein